MRFQVFLSFWSVSSCLCIDKIPEVAKTKVSKPEIFFIKMKTRPCPPKTAHLNTPHMSTSRCGKIFKTPPKFICNERRWNFYSRYSIVAAASAMSWRRCLSLWQSSASDSQPASMFYYLPLTIQTWVLSCVGQCLLFVVSSITNADMVMFTWCNAMLKKTV